MFDGAHQIVRQGGIWGNSEGMTKCNGEKMARLMRDAATQNQRPSSMTMDVNSIPSNTCIAASDPLGTRDDDQSQRFDRLSFLESARLAEEFVDI